LGDFVLKWCAYCQQFAGETPEYHDFSITHVLCASCERSKIDIFGEPVVDRAAFLRRIFNRLFTAGRADDFDSAAIVVEEAIAAPCRPIDVLIGMIAPMLYHIGKDWECGAITVEDEHRFTAFSERVVDLVESRMRMPMALPSAPTPSVLLMNATGNKHVLAIRMLSLWLRSRGINTRILDEPGDIGILMQALVKEAPGFCLISMALVEQRDHVADIVRRIRALPEARRPRVVVGGYPVKVGLVRTIPGAELVADINTLSFA
jgi:methanogenic corrinoid protein MtbC1